MFQIIKKEDPTPVGKLKILIYGQPGIGKTSLANTAKNTITLDFDHGSHRAIVRNDIIQLKNWSEAAEFSNAKKELESYDTIVIDTIGKALDMIIADLPIKSKRADGQPTLQGYGTAKNALQTWIKQLSLLGKDIVFIAHDKEDKSNDTVVIRPDITGSTLQTLVREVDLIGFLRVQNKQRVLDFNPADDYIGKNCAGFDSLEIKNNYSDGFNMESIIDQTKTALESMTEEQKKAIEVIKNYSVAIEECEEPKHFQDMLVKITKEITQKSLQTQLWVLLTKQAKSHEVEFDREKKEFVSTKKGALENTDISLIPEEKPPTEVSKLLC